MQRRDALRLLTSAAALSVLPGELILALRQARAEAGPSIGLRILNQHQDATVTAMSELIIPETDTPGAKGARVNEFIDLMLAEWFDQADTSLFLQGLTQVDVDSRKRFGANFIACNSSQQADLIGRLDNAAMEFARTHNAAAKVHTTSESNNFFYTFKRLTLVGYYTSEIGFKKELGKTILPPGHAGCAPVPEVRS
jgi:hypothetical protein